MTKGDFFCELGHRVILPAALILALAGVFASIAMDRKLEQELECEKNSYTVWDAKRGVCLPRARPQHSGPTPPHGTPNPINYGKPLKEGKNGQN